MTVERQLMFFSLKGDVTVHKYVYFLYIRSTSARLRLSDNQWFPCTNLNGYWLILFLKMEWCFWLRLKMLKKIH